MMRLAVVSLALVPALSAQTLAVIHKDVHQLGIYSAVDGGLRALVPTGEGPHEVAISGDGRWAVATDYGAAGPGGSTLTVVDLRTAELSRTITLPYARPHGAKFLPDHKTLAVTAERDGKVVLVDVTTGTVSGELNTRARVSHMVSLSPDGRTAYTANIADGTLSIIPMDGSAARIVPVGTQTEAVNTAPDGRTVWVGSNNTGKVLVVDVAAGRVIDSVQTSGFPYRIDFTPDTRLALVTNPDVGAVQLIDAATRRIIKTVAVGDGSQPFGIAVAPDGSRAWITLRGAGEVVEMSLPDGAIARRWSTGPGTGPDGIAFAP
jgi:YVTN family beta-propeller protein